MTGCYLNAASHGLPAQATLTRMRDHLALELEIGPLAAADAVADELLDAKRAAADLIGAAVADVALTSTTTATLAGVMPHVVKAGDRVLVAPQEWGDNLRLLAQLGARISVLPMLEAGDHTAEAWQAALTEDIAAVFLPLVSSVTGAHLPGAALGQAPRPDGCRLIVDAAQALGQGPVDVAALGADVVVGTCRKWLRGPRGTALVWRAPTVEAAVPMDAVQPNDANVALGLGLGQAIRDHRPPDLDLRDAVFDWACARGMPTWDGRAPQTGAITLALPEGRIGAVQAALAEAGIVVKFPNPARDEPGLAHGPEGSRPMRVSPHTYNDAAQIDALLGVLAGVLG